MCEHGGSQRPPLKAHAGDNGPGKISEGGHALDGGFTIYRNVTIMNNNIRFSDGAGASLRHPVRNTYNGAGIG